MKRVAFILAVFAALTVVVASADAAGIGPSQAPNIKVKNGYSSNWAGYAVPASHGQVSDVVGKWTVPTLACSQSVSTSGTNVRAGVASNGKAGGHKPGGSSGSTITGYSSTWVGIDGDNSNTVEQIGTEQDCVTSANGEVQSNYAWYEMYPKYPVNLDANKYPVKANDVMTAEVAYTGKGYFQLTLSDYGSNNTLKWKYSAQPQYAPSAKRSSAEWIVEAPWSGGVLPLADFSPVTFSGSQANFGNGLKAIDSLPTYNSSDDAIIMVDSSGSPIAVPSGLNDSTNSVNGTSSSEFTVTRQP